MIVCDFEDDSEMEPTDPLDMGIIRCNMMATRFRLKCIHPPCPSCNQYNSEVGVYLGPQPEPNNNEVNYYYCYPSCEDQFHMRLNYCEKHYAKPSCTKPEWREMYFKVKRENEEMISNA
jgi:hypothetical protein